jgi:hypothetical protein
MASKGLAVCVVACLVGSCGRSDPPTQRAPAIAPRADAGPSPAQGPRLLNDWGRHHHPIRTSVPAAQEYFNHGMSLVFAFNHEEAARSFQHAAELDPMAAMPHWGIAWAVGPNYNLDIDDPRARQAFAAIRRAEALSEGGPDQERDYIAAMARRYSADPAADRSRLGVAYRQAMRELVRAYPDDLDAATLYAESMMNLRPWKLWSLDGKPAPDTVEIVNVLESVLRRAPHHVGANHFYIHAIEASNNPERGLPSAARLETLAPAAGHLVHMPAHIYARTGDHAAAARANTAGAEADRAYMKTVSADNFYAVIYYSHNLHFLSDSQSMRGRFEDSKRAAAELSERLAPHASMMPMIESMIVTPVSVLLRFARHDDVLKQPEPPADRPVIRAWWRFARAVSFARMRRIDEALAERTAFAESVAAVPESALFGGTGLATARSVLAAAELVLDARVAWARDERARAIALWTQAVDAVDRLPYDEPPVWYYPARESLGAALLLATQPAAAERVFRADLERHPRNGRSLFGLHESLVEQKKDVDARWVKRELEEAWKDADVKLSLEDL